MAEDVTAPSADEQERQAYQSSNMMGWKRWELGAAADRVITFAVTVPAGITVQQIAALRAAIGALPNAGVAAKLTNHPVKHWTGYNSILAVQSQVVPEQIPVEPPV